MFRIGLTIYKVTGNMKITKYPWQIILICCLPIAAIFIVLFFMEVNPHAMEITNIIEDNGYVSDIENDWITIKAGPYTYGETSIIMQNIDYDYDIMKYEVTNNQYSVFLNAMLATGELALDKFVTGYYAGDTKQDPGLYPFFNYKDTLETHIRWNDSIFFVEKGFEYHPVVEVTWFGANAYAEHYGLALPTEYEWEKAARGNSGYIFPWGDGKPNCELATFINCSEKTTPIGSTSGASPYGVHDLAGNVFEWTRSFWDKSSDYFVIRGGSWSGLPSFMYTFNRYKFGFISGISGNNVGFRCIRRLQI